MSTKEKNNALMKFLRIVGLLLFLQFSATAYSQKTAILTVEVDSIQTLKGKVFAAIFTSQDNFKNDEAFRKKSVAVKNHVVSFSFNLPVDKMYSVALFQDIDNNNELNTKGAMKVPDEPIGFSNNKLGRFGPPDFDKTSFRLMSDTTIKVHIVSSRKEYFKRME